MVTQHRHGVRAESRVVDHTSEGGRMATHFGNRAAPEGRSSSECLQRITVAAHDGGRTLAWLPQQVCADRPGTRYEAEKRDDAVVCCEGAVDIKRRQPAPLCPRWSGSH